MTEPNKSDRPDSGKRDVPNPLDGFAAATAVGFAMTAQVLDLWFGVMSGVAKASKDMFEPHLKTKSGEPAAYAPSEKPATVKAKAATRTVVADIERTVHDVAEVAVGMLGGKAKPLVKETPAAEVSAKTADVVAFEAKTAAPKPVKAATKAGPKRQPKAEPLSLTSREAAVAGESQPVESVEVVSSPIPSSQPETPTAPVADIAPVEPVAVDQAVGALSEAVAGQLVSESAAAPIMPEDFRQPKATDRPDLPDDLKSISGIGPKLEKVLNGLGVWTFEQLAAWTPQEIAWVDDYLGLSGRISRDGWVAQADGHAKGMKAAG